MTVQFNEERYQSDRSTFERQQFEEACTKVHELDQKDCNYLFARWHDTGNYINSHIQTLWNGWKLAKGLP